MRRHIIVAVVAFAVIATACGDDEGTTTTTGTAGDTTTDAQVTTTAAPGATTTTADTTTTAAETTTTAAATTTTQAAPTPEDAQALVDAKTAAFAAAAPDGWTVEEEASGSFEEADFTYAPCLGPDDFDLDDLDPATIAVKEVRASAPSGGIPFGSTTAIVESRVYESEEAATDVFAVIERIYGTDEGRQCMSDIVTALISEQSGGFDLDVSVEAIEVAGAEVGNRMIMSTSVEGFDVAITIDLVGHRDGLCTVIGTFISFGEEFPADVADTLFSAAASA